MANSRGKRVIRNRAAQRRLSVLGKSTGLCGVQATRVESLNSCGHETSFSLPERLSIQRPHRVLLVNLRPKIRPPGALTSRHLPGRVQLLARRGVPLVGVHYPLLPTRRVDRAQMEVHGVLLDAVFPLLQQLQQKALVPMEERGLPHRGAHHRLGDSHLPAFVQIPQLHGKRTRIIQSNLRDAVEIGSILHFLG